MTAILVGIVLYGCRTRFATQVVAQSGKKYAQRDNFLVATSGSLCEVFGRGRWGDTERAGHFLAAYDQGAEVVGGGVALWVYGGYLGLKPSWVAGRPTKGRCK